MSSARETCLEYLYEMHLADLKQILFYVPGNVST
jgi:hypothetical protein